MFPQDADHLLCVFSLRFSLFGLLWSRTQRGLLPDPLLRNLVFNRWHETCLNFLHPRGESMLADVALPGHYYLCIHLCSHWNNSRAPAAPFAPLWGGHQSRSAPPQLFLIQLDVPLKGWLPRWPLSARTADSKESPRLWETTASPIIFSMKTNASVWGFMLNQKQRAHLISAEDRLF